MEEMLQRILSEITGMKADIGGIKQDVGGLKQDVSEMKQDVGGLKQDVSELKQDVSVLKQDVGELKQDVSVLKQKVNVLEQDVAEIKIEQRQLQVQLSKTQEMTTDLIRIVGNTNALLEEQRELIADLKAGQCRVELSMGQMALKSYEQDAMIKELYGSRQKVG